jgi:hypothetical protein
VWSASLQRQRSCWCQRRDSGWAVGTGASALKCNQFVNDSEDLIRRATQKVAVWNGVAMSMITTATDDS